MDVQKTEPLVFVIHEGKLPSTSGGASPGYFLPTGDSVGDEENPLLPCPGHRGAARATAEPPAATHTERGAQLPQNAFMLPQGSATLI